MMMTNSRVSAVFNDRSQAEQAVNALRAIGVTENHLSIISQHDTNTGAAGNAAAHDAADTADNTGKGLLAGAGVGAMFGIAAALIPGVGPFITAGTLLSTALGAVGGGAVAGAVVGGTTGAVAGALAKSGYNENDAKYYGNEIESGRTFVAVDGGDAVSTDQIRATLAQYGGRSAQVS